MISSIGNFTEIGWQWCLVLRQHGGLGPKQHFRLNYIKQMCLAMKILIIQSDLKKQYNLSKIALINNLKSTLVYYSFFHQWINMKKEIFKYKSENKK